MIKYIKNRVVKSNSGISIIFAIIIIILMGLAGSVFAYLTASSSINSRQDLTSAAAKYAAKSGIEIAAYELGKGNNPPSNPPSGFSTPPAPTGLSCPNNVVPPYGVQGSISTQQSSYYYIYSYNLYSGNNSSIGVDNYTPAFCAAVEKYNPLNTPPNSSESCSKPYWIITSNGFAGGTVNSVSAEVGTGCRLDNGVGNTTIIFAENEVSNNNINAN
jgi:hypothetical protein